MWPKGALVAVAAITGALAASQSASTNSTLITAFLEDGYLDLGIVSDAYVKAKAFIEPLTNAEKIKIITAADFDTGNSSWSHYASNDGVDGLNFYFFVSAFSMTNALTQTWDRDLIAAQFKAVGEEYLGEGMTLVDSALLGPLGRVPQGGRQNEAFTPDPYLAGIAVAEGVKAQQDVGVVSAVRHFLLYEQETNRQPSQGGGIGFGAENTTASKRATSSDESYSSNVDDKTLHELYMWPWADAIRAGAMAVMCAMNRVNDTYSCSSNELLEGKLKTELGFPGFVLPDAEAQKTVYGDANAGLDYSSYGEWTEANMLLGISDGELSQERLDDMALRVVLAYYFVGLDSGDVPSENTDYTGYRDVRGNHSALIRKIGSESIALLKNNNANGGGLPLDKPRAISLFGAHAGPAIGGPNYAFSIEGTGADVFQGHLIAGGGSGSTSAGYVITPYLAMMLKAAEDGSQLMYILNNTYAADASSSGFPGGGFSIGGGTGSAPSYAGFAEQSDVCICFINSWSGEGADRTLLYDNEQDEMVNTVASSCNNTVVVVNVSGPRVLDAWIENDNITAVIYSGLLGQESGYAITDILYGDVNPSGKLIHTIAKNTSDYPASTCETKDCDFSEGVYIDYRWFDQQDIEPRYPFGHGLSYTTFSFGDVSAAIINQTVASSTYPTGALTLGGAADLFTDFVSVTTSITNSGSLSGAEVAQLYVTFPDEAAQPIRILRGFEKVSLDAGATASNVTFTLERRDLSYWDVAAQDWALASGTYTFAVGSSSRDLRGNVTLAITIG